MGPQLLGTTLEGTAGIRAGNQLQAPEGNVLAGSGLLGLPALAAEHGRDWKLLSGTMNAGASNTGQPLRHSLLVTQVVPADDGCKIHGDYRLVDDGDTVVEHGTAVFFDRAEHAEDTAPALRFATPEWGTAILPYLEASEAFRSAIQAYDGTIGISGNGAEVHFRIYKGKVIEVGRRALKGSDFTVAASGATWCNLILGERNDFMDRAMKGEFKSTGSGYEYLRMTKVLILIIDAARTAVHNAEEGAK